jgi:dihydroceramidase
MQLLDELPMIWTAAILLYASLSRSVPHPARFSIALTVSIIAITMLYLYVANPFILFVSFDTLLISILVVNQRKKTKRSSDYDIIFRMKWVGLLLLILGTACWIVDRVFCDTFQDWRQAIGQPWANLLELHGWW